LRAQASALAGERDALERTRHGALLALYAAESSLARAQEESNRLDRRSAVLAREEASLARRAVALGRSLAVSRERVARLVRDLYVNGETDPLAVVFGAASLDDALSAVETLERAADHNRRLVAQARELTRSIRSLHDRLRDRRRQLDTAREAAASASGRLLQAVSQRRDTVESITRRNADAAARIDSLLAQARAAEQASRELGDENAAPATVAPAAATPSQPEPTPPATAATGTRTLVVDAVAYHLPGRTASGLPVGVGVVAVDPRVIPLGTRMFIPGYGPGIAADVGSAIKGNIIDLWMPSTAAARRWGRRTVTITIYG
jgi:3D (Asp-Asp-Asp) domain-containing protein